MRDYPQVYYFFTLYNDASVDRTGYFSYAPQRVAIPPVNYISIYIYRSPMTGGRIITQNKWIKNIQTDFDNRMYHTKSSFKCKKRIALLNSDRSAILLSFPSNVIGLLYSLSH